MPMSACTDTTTSILIGAVNTSGSVTVFSVAFPSTPAWQCVHASVLLLGSMER